MRAHSGSMSAASGPPFPRQPVQTARWDPQPLQRPPHLLINAQVCGLFERRTRGARCAAGPAIGAAQISRGGHQQILSCCCRRLTAPLPVTRCSLKECALLGLGCCLESAQLAQQANSLQEVPMLPARAAPTTGQAEMLRHSATVRPSRTYQPLSTMCSACKELQLLTPAIVFSFVAIPH